MHRTMFTVIAAVAMTVTFAAAQQPRAPAQQPPPAGAIPAPQAVECQTFTATDARGVVQHYEDCTPPDGLVQRCEVINATDARGRVRKIQNCARVTPDTPR
jgi:hypothetical protein